MNAEEQTITNDTILCGVVCNGCKKTLPPHTVKTHLEDPTNSIFKCPSHKKKAEGFKWGQELTKWKEAYQALQERHEHLITKTLEENEDFLGEVRKSGFKDGMEEESVKTEALKKELAELKQENEENEGIRRDFDDGLLVHSENVLCSYDDVGDYIWLRLKTICQEEPALQDHFDWNELIRGFKGIPELKKELAELKQENENLKAQLEKKQDV
jgi:cell division protein FtsB